MRLSFFTENNKENNQTVIIITHDERIALSADRVITIEDGTIIGGLGAKIKELVTEKEMNDVHIKCFAYPDMFIEHGSPKELEQKYGMDIDHHHNYKYE